MAVMRVQKNSNYTTMSNYHLDDKRLSLKAVGLLSKILRLPDDWDYSVAGLSRICNEGRDAISTAIKELEAAGYIVRRQAFNENGKFSGFEYIVHECPQHEDAAPFTENQQMVGEVFNENRQDEAVPLSENRQMDSTFTDFPLTGNPFTENPQQPNTNIPSTNIPPIVPQKGTRKRKGAPKHAPDWKPERFDAFWEAYPRGESKQAAIAAWDKLSPDDELLLTMAKALKRQMETAEWRRGIGIPYASTWLNQRRWEDERKAPPTTPEPERRYDVWT